MISELAEERLVLLSTHIVSDIEYVASEVWLMKDGKMVQTGTVGEIIGSMRESVWVCVVEKKMVADMMNKYKISNMKSDIKGVELRIISAQKPYPDAMCVPASLEDVFLYYFGEKAGDENVEV